MIQFEVVETADLPDLHAEEVERRLNDGWSITSQTTVAMQYVDEDSGALHATVYYTTFLQRGVRSDAPHLPSVVESLSLRLDALRAQVGALQMQIDAIQSGLTPAPRDPGLYRDSLPDLSLARRELIEQEAGE